ncbi:MAG: tryptophan 7-halogenase [Verrucomicrobiales bacterium]|nr:tryptophan 7-halogenase [Verrucomicrobiales bacterium]MCP5525758.1 tryptophan 7-halogenase [Verrucomicrobiales bacterium]
MAETRFKPPGPIDAVIIGGGPAGASAAAVLAEHGHSVVVLERERFPRYHVGESLLPFTFEPLRRLGLIERMRASAFVKKYSVQFVSPSGKASQPFYFFDRYDRDTVAQTWQVLRSEFDQMLLDHARSRGATVHEGLKVTGLLKEEGRVIGVRAVDDAAQAHEFRARMTLDCTGKEAFAAVRENWRIKDPRLNKVAVWTYYEGAQRDEGIDAGATTVAMIPDKGWFWYIPLHEDRVSVGVVAEGRYLARAGVKEPRQIFEREIQQNPWIAGHLASGRQTGPHYLTSEYSFHSRYCASEGLLLVGDAFAFLDPVFSSGLMLALKSGVMAGDAVHEGLLAGDCSPSRFAEYARVLREGLENMRKLVYAFYNENFSFRRVIEKYPDLAGDITDCLSGDVNKDFSRLWAATREFADLPESLPVGGPLAPNGECRMANAEAEEHAQLG